MRWEPTLNGVQNFLMKHSFLWFLIREDVATEWSSGVRLAVWFTKFIHSPRSSTDVIVGICNETDGDD